MTDHIVKRGDLATYDAFLCGLVPVKVLSVFQQDDDLCARVKVTAERKGYAKGEVFTIQPLRELYARKQVYTRAGQYRFRGHERYVLDKDADKRLHSDGSVDERYAVRIEGVGQRQQMWVARFCGEWIGWSKTKEGAWEMARNHTL